LLARLRWGGMVPEGWRDIFCHVMACQLARIFAPGLLYHEIVAHARLIMPADYVTRDLAGHCSTLMHRARQQHGYRYRKVSLIDLLRITPDEERQMRALISSAEKNVAKPSGNSSNAALRVWPSGSSTKPPPLPVGR